jgi:DNA-binding response OmpR family regulator
MKGEGMAKVLIVDDDPDIVEAGKLILKKEGFEVVTASSREEGLTAVEGQQPDLIILDVMMEQPDDGIAMAQKLRRDGFEKPILMLTSVGRASGLNIGRDSDLVPVDDFQEKPIEPSKLVKKVKELLNK